MFNKLINAQMVEGTLIVCDVMANNDEIKMKNLVCIIDFKDFDGIKFYCSKKEMKRFMNYIGITKDELKACQWEDTDYTGEQKYCFFEAYHQDPGNRKFQLA